MVDLLAGLIVRLSPRSSHEHCSYRASSLGNASRFDIQERKIGESWIFKLCRYSFMFCCRFPSVLLTIFLLIDPLKKAMLSEASMLGRRWIVTGIQKGLEGSEF